MAISVLVGRFEMAVKACAGPRQITFLCSFNHGLTLDLVAVVS